MRHIDSLLNPTSSLTCVPRPKILSQTDSNIPVKQESDTHTSKNETPSSSNFQITTRKFRTPPLTLATGRRSRYLVLEPEAAVKREIRRRRNREAARRLNEKRKILENSLNQQIQQLEENSRLLKSEIEFLERYKNKLAKELQDIIISNSNP